MANTNNNWLQAIQPNVLAPNEGNNWNNRGTAYSNNYNYYQERANWEAQLARANEELLEPQEAERNNTNDPQPLQGGRKRKSKSKSRKQKRKSRKTKRRRSSRRN